MPVPTSSQPVPALTDARNQQIRLLKELRVFRDENGLDRTADYPVSKPYHFSIVAVMIIIEALGNMYLFAQGNELGLLGGIFEAILLSVVNVGVAMLAGMLAVPQLSLPHGFRRTAGTLGLVVTLLFALLFNLVAAHYRDLLIQSKEVALQQAMPDAIAHPLQISFNGLLLLVLGLVVSALGLWKGYKADDPHPGYGPLSRRYERSKEAFMRLREQHPDVLYPHQGLED